MLKQSVDLHSSRLSQAIVHEAITGGGWDARLDELAAFYRARRDTFEEILRRHFGGLARWRTPSGGLFYWLKLHDSYCVDTRTLLDEAIARGVAFMPGEEFYPNEPCLGTMRLNFSHADAAEADRGLRDLAELIRSQAAASLAVGTPPGDVIDGDADAEHAVVTGPAVDAAAVVADLDTLRGRVDGRHQVQVDRPGDPRKDDVADFELCRVYRSDSD
jgi:hypothetical protein